LLQLLLNSLIMPTNDIVITVAECTKDIHSWLHKEVKLLSEMTMDSMEELISAYIEYDVRWNEIFADSDLDTPLKEMQDICINELKRREENGISDGDLNKLIPSSWELPHSEYVTRFDEIGIHLEDSMFCVMRALVSSTGIMMNASDIEACTTVDISIEDGELCKGGLSRFSIWPSRNEGTPASDESDRQILDGYNLTNVPIGHQRRRIQYAQSQNSSIFHFKFDITERYHIMQNIEYVNIDGSRTKYVDYKKMYDKVNSCVSDKCDENMKEASIEVSNDALSDSCMKQSESDNIIMKDPPHSNNLDGGTRQVINEWTNDEDIKLDELDNPHKKDVTGGKRKNKHRWPQQKKMKRDEYVKTEYGWGKEEDNVKYIGEDVVDFEKYSGKEDEDEKTCFPDLTWVFFDEPLKRLRPWGEKYKHPILPPRDAFREECMWMKLEEAMTVCPMLMKITQTREFEEQLLKLVHESNEFMKDKNIAGTVKICLT